MKTSIFKSLYVQVLTAIAIGILLGHFYPELGAQMKPFGDAFVKLIKMIIAPVIFCTVVTGIAGMESMKAVGRTGAVTPVALLEPLHRQVELGYVKGILARLDEIETADPAYAPFVAEVRELTRNFRLDAIAPLLEKARHV